MEKINEILGIADKKTVASTHQTVTDGDNPDLHLKKGQTYYFVNNAGGSHPFRIQSTTGTGGTVYNDGVTNNSATSGAIILHVQMDAPATLYYQCTAHAALNGTISIT